jgi:hypothetical protein
MLISRHDEARVALADTTRSASRPGLWPIWLCISQRLHFARFTSSSKEPWSCTDTTPAILGGLMA